MSLDDIKQDFWDLKAIRDYASVERERNELRGRVTELEGQLRSKDDSIERISNERRALDEELDRTKRAMGSLKEERDGLAVMKKGLEDEVAALGERLSREVGARERSERELQSKADENAGLRSKVAELEVEVGALRDTNILIGDEVMTLPQLRDYVTSVKSEEISAGVTIKLDAEFAKSVDEESDRRSLTKLDQLERVAWPKWRNDVVVPMLMRLESSFRESVPNLLREVWFVTCDRCGYSYSGNLMPESLNELMRTGYVTVDCGNPNCRDLFGMRVHQYKLSFEALIANHLNQLKPVYRACSTFADATAIWGVHNGFKFTFVK